MSRKKYPPIGGNVIESFKEEQRKDPELARLVKEELQRLELAQQIKDLRESLSMTQEQLAELAGTKQPSIAKIERGQAVPKLDLLTRVAHALGAQLQIQLARPKVQKQKTLSRKQREKALAA